MDRNCKNCIYANWCKKIFFCKAADIKAEGTAAFEKRADWCPLEETITIKGKWEGHSYLDLQFWKCPFCRKPYNNITGFNFCPNCGAKLEE